MGDKSSIREQLKKRKDAAWINTKSKSLSSIPEAKGWLQRFDKRREELRDTEAEKRVQVSSLTAAKRKQLFSIMFPKLAGPLEKAWDSFGERPLLGASDWRFALRTNRANLVSNERDSWFDDVVHVIAGFDADPTWLAAHLPHLDDYRAEGLARVLAASIDLGGRDREDVLRILRESASNQHEIGEMGDHVIDAMLMSGDPEAWEFITKLLLAAQRQEGLRSSILGGLPDAHPGAIRRLLQVILDENLVRFSATVKAMNDWFGFAWDSVSTGYCNGLLRTLVEFIDDDKARDAALSGDDPVAAYLALWWEAYLSEDACLAGIERLWQRREPAMRWVAVEGASKLQHPKGAAIVLAGLGDHDHAVVQHSIQTCKYRPDWMHAAVVGRSAAKRSESDVGAYVRTQRLPHAPSYAALRALLDRMPGKEIAFKPPVFPWTPSKLTAAEVVQAMAEAVPNESIMELGKIIQRADQHGRAEILSILVGRELRPYSVDARKPRKAPPPLADGVKALLVDHLGDSASYVRQSAALGLEPEPVTPSEAARHEELLTRQSSDIRLRAIERLQKLDDAALLASIDRLRAGKAGQAAAAQELLTIMGREGRSLDAVRERLASETAGRKGGKKSKDAATKGAAGAPAGALPVATGQPVGVAPTQDNALGLVPHFTPRPVPTLRPLKPDEPTPAAIACIWSLAELVVANETLDVRPRGEHVESWETDSEPLPLGAVSSVGHTYGPRDSRTRAEDLSRCAAREILEQWLEARPEALKDKDGLELVRAWVWLDRLITHKKLGNPKGERRSGSADVRPSQNVGALSYLLAWALRMRPVNARPYFVEQAEAMATNGLVSELSDFGYPFDRNAGKSWPISASAWLAKLRTCPACWDHPRTVEECRRLDAIERASQPHIERFMEQVRIAATKRDYPWVLNHLQRHRPLDVGLEATVQLWRAGDVSDDELLLRVVRHDEVASLVAVLVPHGRFWNNKQITLDDRLQALIDRLRRRILDIELERGDAETPASEHARKMDPSGGIEAVVPAMVALGKAKLVRSTFYVGSKGKTPTLCALIHHSLPGEADTPKAFAAAVREHGLGEQRLVELAVYAPRWAEHVEHALGWKGLRDAVLWVRAHTKEIRIDFGDESKEPWEARVTELTPIPQDRRDAGAVDRAWFERSYGELGPKRWEMVYDAAKYACSGAGHTRARLFADAMLGEVSEKELIKRITGKRNQDACRALGLVEVKKGAAGKAQVLARYQVLQELRRTSRKHGGSMLQQSEKRAVEIGMENLAWTAGFPDPLRLQWAMEIEEFGDLGRGPITAKAGDVSVTLSITPEAQPELVAEKNGKTLKAIPPAVKKDAKVAPLVERAMMLRRQVSRVRLSLEQAMVRGDEFTGSELADLFGHPLLSPMLRTLVVIGTTAAGGQLMGYPDKGGKVLRGVDGAAEPIKGTDTLRIAHPLDLLAGKKWHQWQAECFRSERVQPFKQVFREVYVPFEAERGDRGNQTHRTSRYSGQQVNPRQALALFGTRGWVASDQDGVQRTDHKERITVFAEFQYGFGTALEVEGLTIAGLSFTKAGTYEPVPISKVPPRLFSETMRDLDLVVSVAHRGEVDPEASLSTTEMRAALLRETCTLLGLSNVAVEGAKAIIQGTRARYALHLGGGTIHVLPGGTLWVVPVQSQHRGRIFLPFADNDPKTAEVLSKAILLARDGEIQDPEILKQLRALQAT